MRPNPNIFFSFLYLHIFLHSTHFHKKREQIFTKTARKLAIDRYHVIQSCGDLANTYSKIRVLGMKLRLLSSGLILI